MCTWRADDLRAPIDTTELAFKMGGMGGAIGTPVAVTDLEFYGEETNAFLVGSEECTVYKTYRHGRFDFFFAIILYLSFIFYFILFYFILFYFILFYFILLYFIFFLLFSSFLIPFSHSKKGEFKPFRHHAGPITGVSAHPPIGPRDFSEYFLSSSMDWSISLWSHKGQGKHIASFEDSDDYISDVAWFFFLSFFSFFFPFLFFFYLVSKISFLLFSSHIPILSPPPSYLFVGLLFTQVCLLLLMEVVSFLCGT